jgi:rod shape determining protein RodA
MSCYNAWSIYGILSMQSYSFLNQKRPKTPLGLFFYKLWHGLHLDLPLLLGITVLVVFGLFVLYSASGQDLTAVGHQLASFGLAFAIMLVFAQISPHKYRDFAPWVFVVAMIMLLVVMGVGVISKGAQRWLDLGVFRFQPSEVMKIALPMMLAWYLKDKVLPPDGKTILISFAILLIPVLIIAEQPDLGTAVIIMITGLFVLLLAGMSWKLISSFAVGAAVLLPIVWHFMHDYQRERILTFLDPTKDPRGSGYHIIQSKIAIGSGGMFGSGWLHGTQTHLQFLPEHATDFIFAVCGEELGFIGCAFLIFILLSIVLRGFYIAKNSQDTFTRLLAGSLTLTFFVSFFVNIGMVIGLLPVVGLPLPLVSYGGSSIVTLMAGFGIIMSIETHRTLF